jgi:23S rRNA (uracil1939-C5)-methyltransferase
VKNGRGSHGVVAVEVDAAASADLAVNLREWEGEGLGRARAIHSTAEAFLSSLSKQGSLPGRSPSLVMADPPRVGLSPEVRGHLLRLSPPFILLVSCDPPTLARDLAALRPGYRLERLVLLDLFPQTHHVETLVLLAGRGIG